MKYSDQLAAASGLWPDILQALGGVSPEQLTNKHQPCPNCGGTDRYRWDDDDGDGGWYCGQCGGKNGNGGGGNGIDLLMRVTGWTFTEAKNKVMQHLGVGQPTPRTVVAKTKPKAQPTRCPDMPPHDAPPPDGDPVAQWCYRDGDGHQLFWIQRYDSARGKRFVHRVWLDGGWHYPNKAKDGFTCHWPEPRPLYRLDAVRSMPYADVLLVEGEKAADAAARLLPDCCVLSWANGSKSWQKTDWSPLKGRFVMLWPDNDQPGRDCMDAIAAHLLELGAAKILTIGHPPGCPEGWDVADSVMTPTEASDFVYGSQAEWMPPKAKVVEPSTVEQSEPDKPVSPFAMLGFRGNDYHYMPRSTGQIIRLAASSHTGTNLTRIAPLEYWAAMYPNSREGVNWPQAVSDLYAQQHAIGEYNPDRIRGRGAWLDQGRSVLHLGERLIIDGTVRPITEPFDTRYHYQRALSLANLSGVQPLSDVEAAQVLTLAERFYWETPASAMLLSGWCALAPICGVLPWRPHLWLNAAAGSGKTAILNLFVTPLLGEFQLVAQGSTTEAFIRQSLKCDAIPVVMDEAESNQRSDAVRMQQILALARQASSESRAIQGRGSPTGETLIYRIRSMFLLSSVATSVKLGADDRRFTQMALRKPANLDADREAERWQDLKRDLENTLTPEYALRLLARTVELIGTIRRNVKTCTDAAALHFRSQPAGDQYGALLAGAWSLQSSQEITPQQALDLVAGADWSTYLENDNVLPDEVALIQTLLQHKLRVQNSSGTSFERTVLELIDMAANPHRVAPMDQLTAADAVNAMGRVGIKVQDDQLMVSNTAKSIGEILRDTPWGTNWGTILARIKNASRSSSTVHFAGIGSTRAVAIPLDVIDANGVVDERQSTVE